MKFHEVATFLILVCSCSSLERKPDSSAKCYPIPFDHIWFRIPADTYNEMGKSTYFGANKLGFFEPDKSPTGTYYGHYLTGEYHTVEIFEEKMSHTPEPLGIGFLSETQGCLVDIHNRLVSVLPNGFDLKPDASWGRYTQLKDSPEIALWVTELKPSYVGDPGSLIDRRAWARWNRRTNKDPYSGEYNFIKVSQVTWNLPKVKILQLSKIFLALGWKQIGEHSFEYDNTRVTFNVVEEKLKPRNYLDSVGLELRNVEQGKVFKHLNVESRKSPPELLMRPL